MGKVFSTEELLYGDFPKAGAHELAAEHIMSSIGRIAKDLSPEGFSYMIHGSVGNGTEQRRSDIDLLIVYPDRIAFDGLAVMLQSLKNIRQIYHVPIEYNIVTDKEAAEGMHRILPMFADYLADAQDTSKYVVGAPADMIATGGLSFDRDMMQYLIKKRDTFNQAVTNYSDTVDWHRFGRALEFPKAIANKNRQLSANGNTPAKYGSSEDHNMLEVIDERITELTEDCIEMRNREYLTGYERYVNTNYPDAILSASRLAVAHVINYQRALTI